MVESFLEKIKEMLYQVEERFGIVELFAVLKMDEITDKWSIIVGSSWVNDENRKEVFGLLIDLMRKRLDDEERYSIARIGILNSREHLVELMLEEFKSDQSITDDRKVNGNIIHEGFILKSEKQQ